MHFCVLMPSQVKCCYCIYAANDSVVSFEQNFIKIVYNFLRYSSVWHTHIGGVPSKIVSGRVPTVSPSREGRFGIGTRLFLPTPSFVI